MAPAHRPARRRSPGAAAACGALCGALILAGCTADGGADGPAPAPASSPGSGPSASAPSASAPSASATEPAPETGVVRSRAPVDAPESVATRHPDTGGSVAADERNDIAKEPGEAAGLVDGAGRTVFRFTVVRAQTADSCPARGGGTSTPERSTFLVLDVEAELAADVAASVAQRGRDGRSGWN